MEVKSIFKIENAVKKFGDTEDTTVFAVNDISMEIRQGEFTALVGPSGSGKSTLLNIMSGLDSPTSGHVLLSGKELSKMSGTELSNFRRDHIGFIFQRFNLINYLSIAENISLPCRSSKVRKQKIKGSMDEEINHLVEHLNLKPYINKTVNKLSVGQQQRVAVARALIGNPEVIIADEPTSSLDDDVTDKFIELLLKECNEKETTVIFVSHDKRLAKHFDREIVLNDINKAKGESND